MESKLYEITWEMCEICKPCCSFQSRMKPHQSLVRFCKCSWTHICFVCELCKPCCSFSSRMERMRDRNEQQGLHVSHIACEMSCNDQIVWQGYKIRAICYGLEWQVCILDWRSEYFQNKLQFHVEGTHIDVTTLQRNLYFIWKMQDLPCKTLVLFVESQTVWGQKVW